MRKSIGCTQKLDLTNAQLSYIRSGIAEKVDGHEKHPKVCISIGNILRVLCMQLIGLMDNN